MEKDTIYRTHNIFENGGRGRFRKYFFIVVNDYFLLQIDNNIYYNFIVL